MFVKQIPLSKEHGYINSTEIIIDLEKIVSMYENENGSYTIDNINGKTITVSENVGLRILIDLRKISMEKYKESFYW